MEITTVRCENCGRTNRIPAAAEGTPRCGNCHTALPWIVDTGDDGFPSVADESALPVLVDLWAPWCGPCWTVSPALEQLARDLAGQVKLIKVNVDEAPELSQRFIVQAVPTLLVMHRGRIIARQAGAAPASALRDWVQQTLESEPSTSGAG